MKNIKDKSTYILLVLNAISLYILHHVQIWSFFFLILQEVVGWLLFSENLRWFSVGWKRSQQVFKKNLSHFYISKKNSRNHVKLLADWCWQSEVGQIGWFSARFLKIFWIIKMAKIFLYELLRTILSLNELPHIFEEKNNHPSKKQQKYWKF